MPLLLPRHGIVVDGLDTPVLFALDFHPDSAGSHGAVAPIAVSPELSQDYAQCTPLPFTAALGSAIAGRPFTFRFIDDRQT